MFKTVDGMAEGKITEKKSKFIANMFYVENEQEAENFLNEIRKKYYDARHHCYAYRIQTENGIIQKQSDDGEPSGTAGAPMLKILEKEELSNIMVVVTRYFGGILLGTGGLVKAYSDALKNGLQNADIVYKDDGYVVEIVVDYNEISQIEYILAKNDIQIISKKFEEKIIIKIEISKEKYKKIVEKTLRNNFKKITTKIICEKHIKILKNQQKNAKE